MLLQGKINHSLWLYDSREKLEYHWVLWVKFNWNCSIGGLMLLADVSHRLLRVESVLQFMWVSYSISLLSYCFLSFLLLLVEPLWPMMIYHAPLLLQSRMRRNYYTMSWGHLLFAILLGCLKLLIQLFTGNIYIRFEKRLCKNSHFHLCS